MKRSGKNRLAASALPLALALVAFACGGTTDLRIGHNDNRLSQTCGGKTCAANEACLPSAGACGASLTTSGTCTPKPESCPEIYGPVCGCDGKEYANDCFAHAAGVAVDHTGTCGANCGGKTCAADEACILPEGQCGADARTVGTCSKKPQACPEVYSPQCGCDGKNYDGPCSATAAGVSIAHSGDCFPTCADGSSTCAPTCPPDGYIDCMPQVPPERAALCEGPYHDWIAKNCPNVGFAL